jgi:hypothetical protein
MWKVPTLRSRSYFDLQHLVDAEDELKEPESAYTVRKENVDPTKPRVLPSIEPALEVSQTPGFAFLLARLIDAGKLASNLLIFPTISDVEAAMRIAELKHEAPLLVAAIRLVKNQLGRHWKRGGNSFEMMVGRVLGTEELLKSIMSVQSAKRKDFLFLLRRLKKEAENVGEEVGLLNRGLFEVSERLELVERLRSLAVGDGDELSAGGEGQVAGNGQRAEIETTGTEECRGLGSGGEGDDDAEEGVAVKFITTDDPKTLTERIRSLRARIRNMQQTLDDTLGSSRR